MKKILFFLGLITFIGEVISSEPATKPEGFAATLMAEKGPYCFIDIWRRFDSLDWIQVKVYQKTENDVMFFFSRISKEKSVRFLTEQRREDMTSLVVESKEENSRVPLVIVDELAKESEILKGKEEDITLINEKKIMPFDGQERFIPYPRDSLMTPYWWEYMKEGEGITFELVTSLNRDNMKSVTDNLISKIDNIKYVTFYRIDLYEKDDVKQFLGKLLFNKSVILENIQFPLTFKESLLAYFKNNYCESLYVFENKTSARIKVVKGEENMKKYCTYSNCEFIPICSEEDKKVY